jgi:hypothetical protein
VLFDYDPSRSGAVPKRLLEGFTGRLQVDGYDGYAEVCRCEGIIRHGQEIRARLLERPGGLDHFVQKERLGRIEFRDDERALLNDIQQRL